MKNRLLSTLFMTLLTMCLTYANNEISQNVSDTWQEQLELMQNNLEKEIEGDAQHLRLVNYIHKGKIKDHKEKHEIIDSLFSCNAPYVLNLDPITVNDTTITDHSFVVRKKTFPRFEIITVDKIFEYVGVMEADPFNQLKQQLTQSIDVGFEYLELEWSYKGDIFKSICIVSNKNGGIVYEPISNNILIGEGEIRQSTDYIDSTFYK